MIRPRSLQARMLALSAAATLVALAVAGWAVTGVLERFVTAGIDRRLDAELVALSSAVGRDGRVDRGALERRLALLDMGPGWRWRIAGPAGTIASSDFADVVIDAPPPPPAGLPSDRTEPAPPVPPGPHPVEGRDDDGAVHLREATLATDAGTVTLTASSPAAVVARPIRGALVPLLVVLAVLAGVFALAAAVQLRLGLHPVRRLRDAVAAIRRGEESAIDEDQPAELRPLAEELNALAADNRAALAAARGSAANLAHALKTPVATLSLTLADDPAAVAEVARIDAIIRHHLARARTAAAAHQARSSLAEVVADVVATVERLYPAATITADIADAPAVAIDAADLTEIVGNLADNAARHAATRVTIAAQRDGRLVRLIVTDDGPGIPADARDWVTRPGARLDEVPSGDGFGLAIVKELAALYGGSIALADAEPHGLAVSVALPIAV